MTRDAITGLVSYVAHQVIQLVSAKEFNHPTIFADKDVIMPDIRSNKPLAARRLVDPLDQSDLLKLFKRAVNGYQANFGVFLTGKIEHLDGIEQARAGCDHF